jgi:hypothetical protein
MDYEKLYEAKADSYYHHRRSEMLEFVPSSVRTALDVSCGNGAFGLTHPIPFKHGYNQNKFIWN